MNRAVNSCSGRWAGHGARGSPVPSVFPWVLAVGHRPVPLGWQGKAALVTGQGCGAARVRVCVRRYLGGGPGVGLSPLGTLMESQELPCPSVPGGKAVELAPRESSHGWKGARPAGLWEPPTPGAHPGCSPDLVAAPARGKQGKGDPGGKGHERVGGSEWALLNCRCWGVCKSVALTRTGNRERDRRVGVRRLTGVG